MAKDATDRLRVAMEMICHLTERLSALEGLSEDEVLDRAVHELTGGQEGSQAPQCTSHEPLLRVRCIKREGHQEPHSDRPGRIWYSLCPVHEMERFFCRADHEKDEG